MRHSSSVPQEKRGWGSSRALKDKRSETVRDAFNDFKIDLRGIWRFTRAVVVNS